MSEHTSPDVVHTPQVHPKSPMLHLLASLLVPGLGQIAAGSPVGGLVTLAVYAACLVGVYAIGGPMVIVAGLVWILGMINGHDAAKRWNAEHDIES